MTQNLLFVCGSLAEGMVHFGKIASFVTKQEKAKARGTVYRLEVGYPVFSMAGERHINGQLLSLNISDMLLSLLDEFHGYSVQKPEKCVFHRVDLDVEQEDGSIVKAMSYAVNLEKLPSSATLIVDGDWESNFNSTPPLTKDLTDRQRQYIRKLGASSGRDIVPINLDLYRELMGKGLIVDKGRRLALTRLGQEVFRYLD